MKVKYDKNMGVREFPIDNKTIHWKWFTRLSISKMGTTKHKERFLMSQMVYNETYYPTFKASQSNSF